MKKQLVLVAGLAVLATPALASKARLQALGEDTDGSFYINDNRNIFLNASEVLNHKDMVTFEWGSSNTATDRVEQNDTNAEGGFLRASGNMVWGAQLGRITDFADSYVAAADRLGVADANIYTPGNALDFFIGGDAGVKWGVQATYASNKDDNFTGATGEAEFNQLDLAVGVSSGNIAGYVKYGLSGKAETETDDQEFKRKTPIELGVSYKWMEYTFFGQYDSSNVDAQVGTTEADVKSSFWQLGAGRSTKLSDKATLFTKVAYQNTSVDWDDNAAQEELGSSTQLPVTIGLEYDSASWLTLRASISQSVFVNKEDDGDDKQTAASTTNVNAGASIKFGDLSVDGVLGTNNDTDDTSESGIFNTDNLLSRVSMTYRF